MGINILFADDEQPARQKLRRLLESRPDIETLYEAGDGLEVLDQLGRYKIDLVLLDINMPRLGGLDAAREILNGTVELDSLPYIIFITAYDDHAVEAFELNAVDYLLKPYTEERLNQALQRAMQRETAVKPLKQVLARLSDRASSHILIKSGEKIEVVLRSKIDWVESSGNYVSYHCGKKHYLQRNTMEQCLHQLGYDFVRIHRGVIVNVNRIEKLEPLFKGDYLVFLDSGQQLRLSRRYRELFLQRFESR